MNGAPLQAPNRRHLEQDCSGYRECVCSRVPESLWPGRCLSSEDSCAYESDARGEDGVIHAWSSADLPCEDRSYGPVVCWQCPQVIETARYQDLCIGDERERLYDSAHIHVTAEDDVISLSVQLIYFINGTLCISLPKFVMNFIAARLLFGMHIHESYRNILFLDSDYYG